MRAAFVAVAVAASSGCPRLPPPAPRPSVSLNGLERAAATGDGLALRARFRVHNRGAARLVLAAVDWELALGERALLRGRETEQRPFAADEHATVDVAIAIPAAVADELREAVAGGRIRLRGTFHLVDPGGGPGAPAPFDELASLPW
jgi:hypothetical protein